MARFVNKGPYSQINFVKGENSEDKEILVKLEENFWSGYQSGVWSRSRGVGYFWPESESESESVKI